MNFDFNELHLDFLKEERTGLLLLAFQAACKAPPSRLVALELSRRAGGDQHTLTMTRTRGYWSCKSRKQRKSWVYTHVVVCSFASSSSPYRVMHSGKPELLELGRREKTTEIVVAIRQGGGIGTSTAMLDVSINCRKQRSTVMNGKLGLMYSYVFIFTYENNTNLI